MKTHVNMAAVTFLNQVRKNAIKDHIRATQAMRLLLEEMPEITRAECYWSAPLAGINCLTARNVWDKAHH